MQTHLADNSALHKNITAYRLFWQKY